MAYAAVQSLMQNLEQVMGSDPSWVLHKKQQMQIESLQEKVSFLRDFLEEFSTSTSESVKELEMRIRDSAYNAEDIIESYVRNQLLSESGEQNRERGYQIFCQDLEEAIEDTRLVHKQVMEIRSDIGEFNSLQRRNCLPVDRSRMRFSGKNTTMVGFDDESMKVKDWLTSLSSKLEVISIMGMGGIGKTTLANNVFDDKLIVYHFDVRSWVTVSQEYQVREILEGLLRDSITELDQASKEKLAERLHKSLKGRRYLIVLDDLWETKAWDDVKRFFPDDDNGSRVIVTTRLTSVGVYAASDNHVLKLNLLSTKDSWKLLRNQVFGEESCPHYLMGIGQVVASYCQGLPLSIVVIGGLLSMDKTVEYWETISSTIYTLLATEDGQCSKILSLSYNHLPAHLKPCFLYFAVFPEDHDIRRVNLIKLWAAEGFLKPENSNSLEDIAERYLEDLVSRSLIMVFRLGYGGKVKTYRIHDLLRDFCMIEAQKTKFFVVTNRNSRTHPKDMRSERRVSICQNIPLEDYFSNPNGPAFLTRSIQCFNATVDFPVSELVGFRLLRTLNIAKIWLNDFPIEVVRLVHLRYLSLICYQLIVPSSISSIWGLQTLIIDTLGFNYSKFHLPLAVWKMPFLRHVQIEECYLPDPPCSKVESQNFVALSNLQTLSVIVNFRFTDEIVKRLPKLKKLEVLYDVESYGWTHYHLSNIVCLNELETLKITSLSKIEFPQDFKFPSSLKKLNFSFCHLSWKDLAMVGSLPNLEVLILRNNACKGEVWEPNEGEFCELKLLRLQGLDLVQWRADGSHFPKLRYLQVFWCSNLEEIPSEIGNIETLEMIELKDQSSSAVTSAELILEEQRSFGNDVLQVHIKNTK